MHTYDTIVIGGGVIGCSIAYRLAASGRTVALFDSGTAGTASIAAGGMLGAQNEFDHHNPLMSVALTSRAMFPDLRDELFEDSGIDIELRTAGLLKIAASSGDRTALKRQYDFLCEDDRHISWLEPEDVPAVEPALAHNTAGAIYLPDDHQVKAPLLAKALLKAAVEKGAHVYEHTEVTGIQLTNERVTGVDTAAGAFFSDQLICAAGAWTAQLLKKTGIHIPVDPVKGECVSVRLHENTFLEKTVFAVDGCYIVPKRNGELLIGATSVAGSFDPSVSAGGIRSLLNRAARLIPAIDAGSIQRTWAGIRPQTADHLPIIGPHPDITGLFICTGHYRNGILLAPATGMIVRDYLNGCRHKADMLEPFAPARFLKQKEVTT